MQIVVLGIACDSWNSTDHLYSHLEVVMTSVKNMIESTLCLDNTTVRQILNDVCEHFGNIYQNIRYTEFEYQLIMQK